MGTSKALKNQVAEAAKGLTDAENELKTVQEDLREIELGLPNLLDEAVPGRRRRKRQSRD